MVCKRLNILLGIAYFNEIVGFISKSSPPWVRVTQLILIRPSRKLNVGLEFLSFIHPFALIWEAEPRQGRRQVNCSHQFCQG